MSVLHNLVGPSSTIFEELARAPPWLRTREFSPMLQSKATVKNCLAPVGFGSRVHRSMMGVVADICKSSPFRNSLSTKTAPFADLASMDQTEGK